MNFDDFQSRPEVREFMMKMYNATVKKGGRNPSLVQEQARAVNNIKLQINTNADKAGKPKNKVKRSITVKSPSDTTIYSPALKKKRLNKTICSPEYIESVINPSKVVDAEKIGDMVSQLRLKNYPADKPAIPTRMATPQAATAPKQTTMSREQMDQITQQSRARQIAERAILESEKFRASVLAPSGEQISTTVDNDFVGAPPVDYNFNNDNPKNFCQVSNHVDTGTEIKIAKGGFIEVAKLAPPKGIKPEESDRKLELTSKDGRSFWLPFQEKDTQKINNFRQWESCFKVYAVIYTKYNPHCAAEIRSLHQSSGHFIQLGKRSLLRLPLQKTHGRQPSTQLGQNKHTIMELGNERPIAKQK